MPDWGDFTVLVKLCISCCPSSTGFVEGLKYADQLPSNIWTKFFHLTVSYWYKTDRTGITEAGLALLIRVSSPWSGYPAKHCPGLADIPTTSALFVLWVYRCSCAQSQQNMWAGIAWSHQLTTMFGRWPVSAAPLHKQQETC